MPKITLNLIYYKLRNLKPTYLIIIKLLNFVKLYIKNKNIIGHY